jgi:hypothetical protein
MHHSKKQMKSPDEFETKEMDIFQSIVSPTRFTQFPEPWLAAAKNSEPTRWRSSKDK